MPSVFTPPTVCLEQKRVSSYDPREDDADLFVWDVLDPFAPADPSLAYLRALIQAEIERTRRHESIGPLQSLPDPVQDHPLDTWYDSDSDSDSELDADDVDDADDEDSECDGGVHGRDDNDSGDDHDDAADKPNVIAPPQLLPVPLRFLRSPSPSPPSPRLRSRFSDSSSVDDKDVPAPSQVYDDIAEAEERAARKAKRDAHRSRLKALAILGPEAASALPI